MTGRPLEPSDLYRLRATGSVALHPRDGSVVYAVGWPDLETDSNRIQLHVHDGDGHRQLTYGHRDDGPTFSPDGTTMAFARSAPKQPAEIVLVDWETRELTTVASFADGIESVQWLDRSRLVVLAPRRPDDQVDVDDDELARRIRIIDRVDYRFNGSGWIHDRPGQVAVIDLDDDGRLSWLEDLTGGSDYELRTTNHLAVAAAPDGRRLATIASSAEDSDLTESRDLWIHHLDGTTPSRRCTEPGGRWEAVIWHPEGELLVAGTPTSDVHGFSRPHRIDLDAGRATVLGPHDVNVEGLGPRGGMVAVAGGLLAPGPHRGSVTIDRYDLGDESFARLAEGRHQVLAFDASADGERIVASITSVHRPAELWQVSPGEPTRLVSLNDELLAEVELAPVESVDIRSDGVDVNAFVTRPPSSAPDVGSPGPGLIYIHGGPMAQYGYGFFDEFQLAAAAGYTVIGGNPRGADGYGEAWAQSIVGRLGTIDWDDVTAITDHLASLPEVDPNRIGIGGGSYGGFMTSWAISHSTRYRAALVERAVTSWHSFMGTSDIGPPFGPALIGSTIEDDLEGVAAQSPLTYAANIATPTLIVHSEEDWRCPIEQAEQLFVAIRRNGGDATLVRVPGENHDLTRNGSPRHRVERLAIVHDFFDRHLDVER